MLANINVYFLGGQSPTGGARRAFSERLRSD